MIVVLIPVFNTRIIITVVKKKHDIALLLIVALTWLLPQDSIAQVTGRVTDSIQQPIPQVNISLKKTERGTQTDAQGKYAILAKAGDTLIFSHIGRQPVEVHVEKSPSEINVEMPWINIELEGVEIQKAKRKHGYKSQKELLAEYPTNKKLIKTAWLILDKDLSSTFFRIVDGNDLVPAGPSFLFSLQDHFPQMQVAYGLEGTVVYLRVSGGLITPIFDVDGFIQTSPPTYLSANDIDRVALLERNAAISRYGPQGANGVIVVNTKAQTWMDDMGVIRFYDNRSLADSLLREVTLLEPYRPHESFFMGELHNAKTEKEALDIYEGQKDFFRKNPFYFIEAYDFFLSRWGNEEKSIELVGSIMDDFSNDVPVLKTFAYLHQKYGQNEDALNIYLEILKLQYDLAQSHRDVANAYTEVGDFTKAMEFYTNYMQFGGQLTSTPFDAYGDDLLITTEMENMLERNKVDFPEYKDMVSAMDHSEMRTRLVFEWNNPESEFELQFVAPDGYFDTWSNKAVQGYSCKQFFIDQENKGVWQVNIDYKYKQSEVPTYLKVSVYHDYGLTSQEVDIKVYQLSENHEKVQLFMLHEN